MTMTIIVRYLKAGGLILAILLLQGCPKSMAITIHNNTKSEMLLVLNDGNMKWPTGTSLRFDADMNRFQWVHEDKLYVPLLKLSQEAKMVSYKLMSARRPVPTEYIGKSTDKGFDSGTQEYCFQLEPDGNLYIVRPGSSLPATAFKSQPLGFPIKPEASSK